MEIPEMSEIPQKIARKSREVFCVNVMIQYINLPFTFVKSRKIEENLSGKFPGNFPENSRKIMVFFRMTCNDTERKSLFLLV